MTLKFATKMLALAMVVFAVTGTAAWAQSYLISTVAGGGAPPTPAPGLSVGFPAPQAVAEDAAGNVYFCAGNWVFKVDSLGILTLVAGGATSAGLGDGGLAVNARLGSPVGLAVDGAGQIYISDMNYNRVRKVATNGIITTVAGDGVGGNSGDGGPALNARFLTLMGLAVDSAGNLYIADQGANKIRKVTTDGKIATMVGTGDSGFSGDGGPAASAQLNGPHGLALDAKGNLFITDQWNNRIREVTPDGNIATVAGNGTPDFAGDGGQAVSAEIRSPWAVALDAAGDLFIADTYNQRIRKVTPDGTITTVAAGLAFPSGVASNSTGDLAVAILNDKAISRVTAAGVVTTVAGNGSAGYSGDGGPAVGAEFGYPFGVAVDPSGNFYIADPNNHQVRKVGANGVITTVAGTGIQGFSGDGGPAASAQLNSPGGVATDSQGNLYIADSSNLRIRKVTPGGTITTVAGSSAYGYSGDGGPATAAGLKYPQGVAVDAAGRIYIADTYDHVVRRVGLAGNISTLAGNNVEGFSGDGGPATSAELDTPWGVAVDGGGNVLIADLSNNRIRKVTVADGSIVTVAGNGSYGDAGDGGQATLASVDSPEGVAVDAAGNILIADVGSRIRRVALDGTITTVAGNGSGGYSGDGGPATSAQIDEPGGIAVSAAGAIYIADTANSVIRLLTPAGTGAVLGAAKTHSGVLMAGQSATYSVAVGNAAGAGPTSGVVTVTEIVPAGLTLGSMSGTGWSCSGSSCTRSDALSGGSGYPTIAVTVNVAAGGPSQVENVVTVSGGGSPVSGARDWANILLPGAAPVLTSPANGAGGVVLAPTLTWNAAAGAASYDVYFGTSATPPFVGNTTGTSYAPGVVTSGATYYWQVVAQSLASSAPSATWSFTTGAAAVGLQFIPVTPCRVADTRGGGPFGGPSMTGDSSRSFAIPQSACGIPATALAYSLNVTVVPQRRLSYLTLWPTGQSQAMVSTLNSWAGDVVANAAIVPAGTGGAVSVYVTDPTDVILDINGYFDTSTSGGSFSFYPATPCRVVDTRSPAGTFGGPTMLGATERDFPIPMSPCGIPATAGGYSLNVTVVPPGYLGYLSTWPTGQAAPVASTLNSWKGKVVANAALVPAGANESISVYVSNPTDVILDINGYFGQPGHAGSLAFYPVAPCRIADTRNPAGPFGGPELGAGSTRSFPIPASTCNVPATAAAYSLNVTVVPDGRLSYLSAWPSGSAQPVVSTLNSWDGSVVANAAIVPAGTGGAISIFAPEPTQVILDINGYFAP